MAKKKEERAHALLSASSAKKWIHCTPSARLEDSIPDEESPYAAEGTLAHDICDLKLSKLFTDRNMTERTYKGRLKKLQENELYSPEMDRYADEYVDYISSIALSFPTPPSIWIEQKVNYSNWAHEGYGFVDCLIIYGTELHVIDFKYGKGIPVKAEGNYQLALYALGAYQEYGFLFNIENVHLHIIQPRIPNNSSWSTTLKELLVWGEKVVKPAAEKAFKGEGDFRPADYCNGDKENYCKDGFCKAYGRCRATMEKNMDLFKDAWDEKNNSRKLPPLLSWEEVGQLLNKAMFLKSWVENLQKISLERIVSGQEVPGWKAIEGRSNRKIGDVDSAFKELADAGYAEEILYDRKPIALGELERLVSKEDKENILQKYIVKPQGAPTLAPEDDKRPAMVFQRVSAEEAFGGANTYKEEK
ncbi:MAG: DUF2800 domain-containing protein [Lachnospiraceae bacterium]|nr:DUF2800 domain-containing protein [Lachnospiraceae bacterium]